MQHTLMKALTLGSDSHRGNGMMMMTRNAMVVG